MESVRISNHVVSPTDSYMFDTNVWIYLFGPVAGSNRYKQKMYSGLLKDILSRNACIFISSLVLSEYINRVLRIAFSQWKQENCMYDADFKRDYRKTEDYREALEDVVEQVREILSITERRPDDFNAINVDVVLDQMTQDCDYNDSYLIKCCEKGNIKLVSDDRDVRNIDSLICVISA